MGKTFDFSVNGEAVSVSLESPLIHARHRLRLVIAGGRATPTAALSISVTPGMSLRSSPVRFAPHDEQTVWPGSKDAEHHGHSGTAASSIPES